MNKYAMHCQYFQVSCDVESCLTVTARFVLPVRGIDGKEEIAEALRRVALQLCDGEGINLVKAGDKPRCFYCGQLNEDDRLVCAQCGGEAGDDA